GLAGGKGVPESVALHPAVFVTLTAPSFGIVHTRVVRNDKPQPCRVRRDRPVCVHGKPMSCNAVHSETDHRLGQPLCLDCYDHQHQVVWNHLVAKLWDRTMLAVRRHIGATPKGAVKLRYAKVAEYQRRGVVHLHALLRLDANLPGDPHTIAPPPFGIDPNGDQIPLYTAAMLKTAVEVAARSTGLTTAPHPEQPRGWELRWGTQVDVKVVRTGLPGEVLTEQHVAGYLAKYATKATEITGVNAGRVTAASMEAYANPARHTNRLIIACWNLGAADGWIGLRRWAHMLGFGGHFATKSRRYSTTMGALRAARRPDPADRITVRATTPGEPVALVDAADDSTVLVINHWQHVGNGWRTSGDAALAAMAADAARQRRPHVTTANVN
ncbi:replication initiator, partial [Catellatospora chokoriensis]